MSGQSGDGAGGKGGRVNISMPPSYMTKLRVVALDMKRSRSDAIRMLIDERHAQIVAERGESDATSPTTTRE
jgi:hypothetical protein